MAIYSYLRKPHHTIDLPAFYDADQLPPSTLKAGSLAR